MAFKRYIANCTTDFVIHLALLNGEELKLRFIGKDYFTKQRFVDVEDPLIQKALEEHKDHGVYYNISDVHYEEPATITPDTEVVKEFPNSEEARVWLNKNHNVPLKRMMNKQMITEQYELLGFKIKFLSDN
jgi:hypothetical protein